jgi:hypothetical protein
MNERMVNPKAVCVLGWKEKKEYAKRNVLSSNNNEKDFTSYINLGK